MRQTSQEVTIEELPETPEFDGFEIVRWEACARYLVVVVRERADDRKPVE